MSRKYLLFFFLLTHIHSHSQEKTSVRSFTFKGDPNCVYKNKFSAQECLSRYPFNVSNTIKLISFRYHFKKIPIRKDTLITDSLLEVRVLSKQDVVNLTDILYNNFYKKQPNYGSMTLCFYPRNAILFFDKNGNLRESIILCFECGRYSLSSEEIQWGDECDQKVDKLKMFFSTKGIKFGLKDGPYPGETYDDDFLVPPPKT